MNAFKVAILSVCMTFCAAQIGSSSLGTSNSMALLQSLLSGGGPLASLSGGTSTNSASPATTGTTGGNTVTTTNTATSATGEPINSLFTNPFSAYAFNGFDNLQRAAMAPFMSQFGNTAGYYWLTGGADKFTKVAMSELLARQMASSTGMNPVMTSLLTGQMMDAPDNYPLNKMLFNAMNGRGNAATASNAVPTLARPSGTPATSGRGGMDPMAFLLMSRVF